MERHQGIIRDKSTGEFIGSVFCALSVMNGWRYALPGVLALSALLLWPVDVLVVRLASPTHEPAREILFTAVAPLGQSFSTEYLHSVQLTPVQDIYRIVNGRIWSWQERVQSHNAGLPFAAPTFGRFRMESPWMVVEGGRHSWEHFFLRVGNAELGRNVFFYGAEIPSHLSLRLFEAFPGKRLQFGVERRPLFQA